MRSGFTTRRTFAALSLVVVAIAVPGRAFAAGELLRTFTNPTPDFVDPNGSDLFGQSIAMHDGLVIVGAEGDDEDGHNTGAVYIFDGQSGSLLSTIPNPMLPQSGAQVQLFGRLVLGGHGRIYVTGSMNDGGRVHQYDSTGRRERSLEWRLANNESDAGFGAAIAASDSKLVVGVPWRRIGDIRRAGVVHVFDDSMLDPAFALNNPAPSESDGFGAKMAASGEMVAIAGPGDSAVYLFNLVSRTLNRTFFNPGSGGIYDGFGSSLAFDGSIVAVGAQRDDWLGAGGAAWLFDANKGELLHELRPPMPLDAPYFGVSIAINGSIVYVGAPHADLGAEDSGAVFAYDMRTGEHLHTYLNPVPSAYASFGESLAPFGSNILIGAPLDDTGATDAGIVYLFEGVVPEPPADKLAVVGAVLCLAVTVIGRRARARV